MKLPALIACLALLAPAAGAAADLESDLVRHAVALERAIADAGAGRLAHAGAARLDADDAALRARLALHRGDLDAALLAKAERLEGLRSLLREVRTGNAPADLVPTAAPRDVVLDALAGASCESALPLRSGEALRHPIRAGASVWYRVEGAGDAALRVSTRGSSIDPALAAFADCRVADRAPLAQADDSFGLQADLALVPHKQTFWYVRADNLGDAGDLVVSALRAIAITGRVTRAADGTGVANVRVALFRNEIGFFYFTTDTATDANGNYALSTTLSATYAIRTADNFSQAANLVHQAYDGFRCSDGSYFNLSSCGSGSTNFTPIALTDPTTRTIDFALDVAGSIAGTLTSSAGGPVAAATVSLHGANGQQLRNTTSDALGRWRIDGVPPTGVYITAGSADHARTLHSGVECPNNDTYYCPWASGTQVTVPVETLQRVDMTLRRQQFVEVVFTVNGGPAPGDVFSSSIVPSLLNSNGVQVAQGWYLSPGRYRLGPVAPGSYRLRATANFAYPQLYPAVPCATDCIGELGSGTPIVVAATDGTIEVAMNLRRYPRIEGRLTSEDDGSPIGDATVYLLAPSGSYYGYQVNTSAAGEYRFDAVAPGNYLLRFAAPRHVDEVHDNLPCNSGNPGLDCPGATLITVGSSTPDRRIDAVLARSATLSGRFTIGGLPYAGNYGTIHLLTATGAIATSWSLFLGQDGRYTINDVPNGTWRVAAFGDTFYGFVPQIYSGIDCPAASAGSFVSCPIAQATPVVTSPGSSPGGIDFPLRRLGSQVVRVLNAFDNTPLAGVMIDVWNNLGQRVDSRETNAAGLAYPGTTTSGTPTGHALSTDNGQGLINEVYQDIECANGSVFFGSCALTGFTPVLFPAPANAPEIVIRIARPVPIFGGNFEQ
jgi:protocatechuate 3,4-dioxygenase beta subunit